MMIEIDNLHLSYGKKKILQGISFSVQENEIIALIGLSGSGKTTLFKTLTGLLKPDQGKITFKAGHQATYMQQEDLLLPWRTALDNLLLFTELGPQNKRELYLEKAITLLHKLGLHDAAELFPHQLSGGMKQRLSLARSLLQERSLLLLDEPFGSLDLLLREELYQLLLELRAQENKTMILVTHDFRDALSLADRILILQEGKIKETLSVDAQKRNDPIYSASLSQHIKAVLGYVVAVA